MKQGHKQYTGFTLAEVLITLSIIGIIGALTIPGIVKDYQETQFKNAFKKKYADFEQAIKLLIIEHGGSLQGVFKGHNENSKYCNYLKCVKKGGARGTCFHAGGVDKYLNGNPAVRYMGTGAILNDGTLVGFWQQDFNHGVCSNWYGVSNVCLVIFVDVNGWKGPNTWGKDIFSFYVQPEGIIPSGVQGGTGESNNCTNYGFGCVARVLRNIDY